MRSEHTKAQGLKRARGRSLLSHNRNASYGRESVVAHNLAMVKDAENPTVTGNDAPGCPQGKEARSSNRVTKLLRTSELSGGRRRLQEKGGTHKFVQTSSLQFEQSVAGS